jgi:hypothetical protein
MSTLNAQLKIWSDTAANFTAANPTLASGQWAKESDTGKVKLGDGSTAWTSLGYYSQTYTTDTWVPTITGYSSAPTVTVANYTRVGNVCFIHVAFSGTSNATTVTMTLPFTARNSAIQALHGIATDSGTAQTASGVLKTAVNSNVANLYKTLANGAWTNSGTKGFACAGWFQIEE